MTPGKESFKITVEYMTDEVGNEIDVAPHAQMIVKMKLPDCVTDFSIIRKRV